MKRIFKLRYLVYTFSVAMLIFFVLFLFNLDKDRRKININEDNLHLLLNNTKWTVNNIELTVKYDGDSSKHIESYSFDGGNTWTKSNTYIASENEKLTIVVKDILGKLYTVNYDINNIDKTGPVIEVEDYIKVHVGDKVDIMDYLNIYDDQSGLSDDIIIKPKKVDTSEVGTQEIIVKAYDKLDNKTTKTFKIDVVSKSTTVKAKKIEFKKKEYELEVGDKQKLKMYFYPRITSNKKLKYNSSDNDIAKIDSDGTVKALKSGTATITAETTNGVKAECIIKIK